MENLAIIDLGSNSIRFVALRIADNHSYSLQYQEKESIRLGQGLNQTGILSEEGMHRALTCLNVYKHIMEVMKIDICVAVATAAVRNAANGSEFLERINAETGITMKIITGEREAYLGYLGVINTIALKDCLIFDLGGASIELTLVRDGESVHSVSIPIGAVTLTEKFNMQGNIDAIVLQDCLRYVKKKLSDIKWLREIDVPIVGIGGTARNFAKMDQRAESYEFSKIHNYIISLHSFNTLYTQITTRTSANRKKIAGLSSERADLIVAGAAVIRTIFDISGSLSMTVSGCGLREGLFFEYYAKYMHMDKPRFDDILDFSINNFIGTLGTTINCTHYDQVTRITGMLFDQLKVLHGYGGRERLLLMTAARLHDVGKIINFYDHARHSAFMIGHAPLYGLTHREQMIAGFIAGFHHGISRKTLRAYRYASMATAGDWDMIRKLSTLLALAEASDLTYEQIVKDIHITLAENVVVLVLTTIPGATYNAADYEMKQIVKQFKKEFGAALILVWK
ncbi:exopolyphosphatase [Megasphaera cerevisiae DSM 20462]|uniref:Exopolyphosphatase n=1 Tax=Megasphaera cerevisiae DSM 20462 TaxID=1122219 RepID=A0A0J6X135_9FIRM|nr:Ppx/GppA phosphatase family protein [Megasphaera cerevisiae]KMO87867.1 exopolyphosphatase [Megasphaera cerevisiae DSM 20462]SJZ42285.1 exopolyphosphatase / guanosine-5'-triphosphate,3'-diphosphate pyrophosphatase [Megasphaera cerevisiae DSM 20462]